MPMFASGHVRRAAAPFYKGTLAAHRDAACAAGHDFHDHAVIATVADPRRSRLDQR